MHVPHKPEKVALIVTKEGSVPSLKEVPRRSVAPVGVSSERRQKVVHEMTDSCMASSNHEVDMVGHQNKRVQLDVGSADHRGESTQESPTILVITEDPLAPIPSRDEVVEPAVKLESWSSGQRSILDGRQADHPNRGSVSTSAQAEPTYRSLSKGCVDGRQCR